jgi:hypothetical protein
MNIIAALAVAVLAVSGVRAQAAEAPKTAAPSADPKKAKEDVIASNAVWHRIHDDMQAISRQEMQALQDASKKYADERRAIHEKFQARRDPLQKQLQQMVKEHTELALKEGWVKAGTPQPRPKPAAKKP